MKTRRIMCVYWVAKNASGKRIRGEFLHPAKPATNWLRDLREVMPDGCKLYRVTVYSRAKKGSK